MGRTMPTQCEHGRFIDWGDFGPEGKCGDGCEACGIAEEWVDSEDHDGHTIGPDPSAVGVPLTFNTATVITAHVDQLATVTTASNEITFDLAGSVIHLTGHPDDLDDLVHKINVAVGE